MCETASVISENTDIQMIHRAPPLKKENMSNKCKCLARAPVIWRLVRLFPGHHQLFVSVHFKLDHKTIHFNHFRLLI